MGKRLFYIMCPAACLTDKPGLDPASSSWNHRFCIKEHCSTFTRIYAAKNPKKTLYSHAHGFRADMPASALFCQHVLQPCPAEAQIGNQLLQPEILFFKLPHMFQTWRGNPAVFLAPRINCGIGDAQLTTDCRYCCTQLGLLRAKTICSWVNRDFSSAQPPLREVKIMPELCFWMEQDFG